MWHLLRDNTTPTGIKQELDSQSTGTSWLGPFIVSSTLCILKQLNKHLSKMFCVFCEEMFEVKVFHQAVLELKLQIKKCLSTKIVDLEIHDRVMHHLRAFLTPYPQSL